MKQKLGEAAVVLGGTDDGKVALVAGFTPGAIERGLSAAERRSRGRGGGRRGRWRARRLAQAGGREPEKLDDALETARSAIRAVLGG